MIAIVAATNLPLWPRCQISHVDRALQFGTTFLLPAAWRGNEYGRFGGQQQIWGGRMGNKYGQGQQSDVLNEIFRFAARSTFLFAAYWLPSSHPVWNHFRLTPSCYNRPKLTLREMFFFTVQWSMNHQGCISCGILVSGIRAHGVSSEHMENMEMFSCSPT